MSEDTTTKTRRWWVVHYTGAKGDAAKSLRLRTPDDVRTFLGHVTGDCAKDQTGPPEVREHVEETVHTVRTVTIEEATTA